MFSKVVLNKLFSRSTMHSNFPLRYTHFKNYIISIIFHLFSLFQIYPSLDDKLYSYSRQGQHQEFCQSSLRDGFAVNWDGEGGVWRSLPQLPLWYDFVLLPPKSEIYFPASWMCIGLVPCFNQQTGARRDDITFESRSVQAFQLSRRPS